MERVRIVLSSPAVGGHEMELGTMSNISNLLSATSAASTPWVVPENPAGPEKPPEKSPDQFRFEGIPLTAAPPTKAEIAKMGFEKFSQWTLEHTTAKQTDKLKDRIASSYATIKKQTVGSEAHQELPLADADKLIAEGKSLAQWERARVLSQFELSGGDPSLQHEASRREALVADAVGDALVQWNQTPVQEFAKPSTEALEISADPATAKAMFNPPTTSAEDFKEISDYEAKSLQAAIDQTGELPAGSAAVLNQFITSQAHALSADVPFAIPAPTPDAQPDAKPAPTEDPGPAVSGPSGAVKFSYNPKDILTMEPETYTVQGLKGGPSVQTDRIRLSDTLAPSADGNYVFDGGKGFTRANTFAAVANAQNILDAHLGKVPDSTGKKQLTVNADRGEDFNAYFQPREDSVNFFHGTDPKTKQVIYSGDAGDVVGHEYGHKDLNDRRPAYFSTWSADPGAFHESYGDVTAFLESLQDDSVIKKVVEQTGGDLSKTNVASESATQLAQAINDKVGHNVTGGAFLRNADNNFKWADPATLENNPADPSQLGSEVHNFSRLWTGAFYDVFKGVVSENIKAGQDPATAIKNASNEGLAMYGRLFGKNGTAPEGDFTYRDMASAWIKAEREDGGTHADLVAQVMSDRGILPKTASLFESVPETLPAGVRDLTTQLLTDVPDAYKGAFVSTKLSGANDGIFEDAEATTKLQSDVARAIQNGDVLIRADGATEPPTAEELRKPDGSGFYKGYLETGADGQKTIHRSPFVD